MDVSSSPSSVSRFLSSSSSVGHENNSPTRWPKCTKTYNSRWETDPLLKTWIARHPSDKGKVVCRFCQSVIRAHKNDLLEHTRTLKHQRNFMAHATPEEYNQFVMELNELRKDAQLMTKKKVVVKNNVSGNWTPKISSEDAGLSLAPPGDGRDSDSTSYAGANKMWPSPEHNDSYMSADSPSDLVSVILEEQAPGSPQGSHHSTESVASAPPTLTPNSSSPLQQGMIKPEPKISPTQPPFTCQDVLSAIQDNYFNLAELVTLAKASLGQIESSVIGTQNHLPDLNNSLPPFSSSLPKFPKSVGGKGKGRRKRSEVDGVEMESSCLSTLSTGGTLVFPLEPL